MIERQEKSEGWDGSAGLGGRNPVLVPVALHARMVGGGGATARRAAVAVLSRQGRNSIRSRARGTVVETLRCTRASGGRQ